VTHIANGAQRCQQVFWWIALAHERIGTNSQGHITHLRSPAEDNDSQWRAQNAQGGDQP
jgi:hypothetical protein